jgi:hypothetical protein
MIKSLRVVAQFSIDSDVDKQNSFKLLRRIIHIFSKQSFRKLVNVPMEILFLIRHKAGVASNRMNYDNNTLDFVRFITEEVIPDDLLQALIIAETPPTYRPELLPILQRLLARGARMGSELSASLRRIKRARQVLDNSKEGPPVENESMPSYGIWAQMSEGTLLIEK